MTNVINLKAAQIDRIFAELDEDFAADCDIHATRDERETRYAALVRDMEARRARGKFSVVA